MEQILSLLNHLLAGNPGWMFLGAFLWGVVSILLSPCHLSGIPLMLGIMTGQRRPGWRNSFVSSLLFALGILFAVVMIGGITGLMGRMLGDLGPGAYWCFGLLMIFGGLLLSGLVRLGNIPVSGWIERTAQGNAGLLLVGFLFGIALGPCALAFIAPVLGVALMIWNSQPVIAISLFLSFALGHCAVIVAAGCSFDQVRRWLAWNEKSNGLTWMKRVCGILVIVAGIYLITKGI